MAGPSLLNIPGGGYASMPSPGAQTNEVDLRIKVAASDWTPAATGTLASKWRESPDNQRSWLFRLQTNGSLIFNWSENGTANRSLASTATVSATDGSARWVRVAFRANNGSNQAEAKFYTSLDGATWTQLGTTVTATVGLTIFSGSAPIAIGVRPDGGGGNLITAKFYAAELRSAIDGPIIAQPDFTAQPAGTQGFMDAARRMWTVTLPATIDTDPAPPTLPKNLLTDQQASVENGTTQGWAISGGSLTSSTDQARVGNRSLRLAASVAGPYTSFATTANDPKTNPPGKPSTTYTVMYSVFAPVAGLTYYIGFQAFNAAGTGIGSYSWAGPVALNVGWNDVRRVFTTPADTAFVHTSMSPRGLPTDGSQYVYLDRAGLFEGDVPTTAWSLPSAVSPWIVTPDPYRHRVNVALTGLGTTVVSFERVLPGGRIEPVRNAQNVTPTAGAVIFDDYDVPTDTPFFYQVTGTTNRSQSVVLESLGYFFMADPNTPAEAIRVIPAANAIPQMKRDAPVGIHRVLGRADPVVVTDTRWWASGDLTLYTLTNNQREEVGQMTSLGITLALYGPAEVMGGVGRLYFVAPTVDERRVSARGTEAPREWHLDITQVAAPSTVPVTPAAVTWQDVVDSYATWQAVVNGEVDWLDVMRDVPTTTPAPPIGWEW